MVIFPTLNRSLYLRIPWIRWNIALSLFLNAILWAFIYFRVEPQVNPVPFHVSIYFGIDFTAPYWYFFFFPLGGLLITIFHIILSKRFFRSEPTLSFILMVMSTVVQVVAGGVVLLLTRYLI